MWSGRRRWGRGCACPREFLEERGPPRTLGGAGCAGPNGLRKLLGGDRLDTSRRPLQLTAAHLPQCPRPRWRSITHHRHHCAQLSTSLTRTDAGCLPPAYWPPGSPAGSLCWRGEPPGSGPRRAGHGRWKGGDAPSARAASLASSAACRSGQMPRWPRPWTPTLVGTRVPTPATRVPPSLPGGRIPAGHAPSWGQAAARCLRPPGPPRGNGAAAPSSALRAIDPSARPRSWRTCGPRHLRRRSAPDLVATQCGAASCRGQPSPSQVEG